ncbi:radical SAM family heme chaperone HemW [Motiliproteus sediminis]|uniref:radical SAM family heme chaperone HemW n=1 Tax=Motiliproteus sediminis TaxID=1468178 RepID=UPI001AEFC7E6|nr:radical SAM family heme chaperone HemW [Motiliproteus sediminis]
MLEQPPLSLYVHLPWCVRKCPYCDFNSHAADGELPESAYLSALLADLDDELALTGGRALQSIFIGGGTPSLMSASFYHALMGEIRARMPMAPGIEVTMEANPGTFEQARFAGFREAGVNRLSLGVQSFDDSALRALGRIHGGDEARAAIAAAQQLGFDSLNLDLMHGLPGQTVQAAMDDLEQALAFVPTHLSWYQLTIEPNTEFYVRPPPLPVDDTLWEIQEQGQQRLAAAGLEQYEISAYGRAGFQCQHNLNYWRFGDYLGIGAGAHGKLTLSDGAIQRRWKQRQPKRYLGGERLAGAQVISGDELALEFMMNVLRLHHGVAVESFSARTGLPLAAVAEPLRRARERELLCQDRHRLAPTELGRRFLNELLALFYP